MNLVLDDAEEVHLKTKKRRPLGMDFISKICIELSYCKMPQMQKVWNVVVFQKIIQSDVGKLQISNNKGY